MQILTSSVLQKPPSDGLFANIIFLFTGVGTAAQSAMIAELCRATDVKERTPILAVCSAAKQIGVFIGPAFQLLFSFCHFSIFGILEINPLNAAGAFMGVVWLFFSVAALAMFYNLTAELEEIQKSVAKNAQIPIDHGSSVNKSMQDGSLKIKGCSERATFSDYVTGMEQHSVYSAAHSAD